MIGPLRKTGTAVAHKQMRNLITRGRKIHPHRAPPEVAPANPAPEEPSHEPIDEEAELEAAKYFERHPEELNRSFESPEDVDEIASDVHEGAGSALRVDDQLPIRSRPSNPTPSKRDHEQASPPAPTTPKKKKSHNIF